MQQDVTTVANRIAGVLNSISRTLSQPHSEQEADCVCYHLECIIAHLARYSDQFENLNQALSGLEEAHRILTQHAAAQLLGFQAPKVLTGTRGRPHFDITPEQLDYFLDFEFTVPEIARMLSVSVRTVHRRLSEYGLSVRRSYSDITHDDLKGVVAAYLDGNPNSGYRMVNGFLKSIGLR